MALMKLSKPVTDFRECADGASAWRKQSLNTLLSRFSEGIIFCVGKDVCAR